MALFFALMLTPLLAQLAGIQGGGTVNENRKLVDPPQIPTSAQELLKTPAKLDAYLNDHFGLRRAMVEWNNRIRFHLFGELSAPQLTVGKKGFIYFNSHSAEHPLSLVRFLCGQGIGPDWITQTAGTTGGFVRQAVREHPSSTLLIVPTKSVLYPEFLPDWVRETCGQGPSPAQGVVTALERDASVAPYVVYPFEQMMAMKASFDVFPKENFHWDGEGPRHLAEQLSEGRFGLTKLVDLPAREGRAGSDIQHFAPGVSLDILTKLPDYPAAGVTACEGGSCFPELGAAAAKLADVSRYRSARTGTAPRLLVVSDSFGHAIAGYFSQYFGEVWHISTNNIELLTPDEKNLVKQAAFQTYAPDQVLYVYHDFAVGYFTNYTNLFLGSVP